MCGIAGYKAFRLSSQLTVALTFFRGLRRLTGLAILRSPRWAASACRPIPTVSTLPQVPAVSKHRTMPGVEAPRNRIIRVLSEADRSKK